MFVELLSTLMVSSKQLNHMNGLLARIVSSRLLKLHELFRAKMARVLLNIS